jgi:hypothetical protein
MYRVHLLCMYHVCIHVVILLYAHNIQADLLELDDNGSFGIAYNDFRQNIMRDLTRRLCNVLTQAFDDCPTIIG